MPRKPGPKPKDRDLADRFNYDKKGRLTRTATRKVLLEAQRVKKIREAQLKELARMESQTARMKAALGVIPDSGLGLGTAAPTSGIPGPSIPPGPSPYPAASDPTLTPEEEELLRSQAEDDGEEDSGKVKSAYQMLQDMRWVFSKVNGRDRLLRMIKTDDKLFASMSRDMLKIEIALMEAEGKKKDKGDGKGQATLVVIKGLEAEEEKAAVFGLDGSRIDMAQIEAATDPTRTQTQNMKPVKEEDMIETPDSW